MRPVSLTVLVVLLLMAFLAGAGNARADRDIVYAARYYLPPGSHGTSHSHLYRINPDGTGQMQLTFGSSDDSDPHWSPDGQRILFMQSFQRRGSDTIHSALCLIKAGGGPVTKLLDFGSADWPAETTFAWSPDGKTVALAQAGHSGSDVWLLDVRTRSVRRCKDAEAVYWSPDGRRQFWRTKPCAIQDLKTGRRTPAASISPAHWGPGQCAIWLDGRTLVGVAKSATDKAAVLSIVGVSGRETRQVTCRWNGAAIDPRWDSILPGVRSLLPGPAGQHWIVYVYDESISSWSCYGFLRLDLATGETTTLAEGQFLTLSPDGRRFCTAPHRDVDDYDKKRGVWTAPLQVGVIGRAGSKTITPRLSLVTGADWRRGGHNAAGR